MQPCHSAWLKIPNRLLLVDSTTITVDKSRLSWALNHGERSGIKLYVSYTPETAMPLNVRETTGLVHDGPVGERLADRRFILVQDRVCFMCKPRQSLECTKRVGTSNPFSAGSKKNLNVPKLFGQTPNAVYNQLFAPLIAYVLIQWLYQKKKPAIRTPSLSLLTFQRTLLTGTLPLIWLDVLTAFLHEYFALSRMSLWFIG